MGSGAGVPGPLVTLAPVPCDAQQSVCIALDFRLPSELGCKSVFLNGGPEEFTHLLFDLSHSLLHSGRKSYICAFIAPGCSQEWSSMAGFLHTHCSLGKRSSFVGHFF